MEIDTDIPTRNLKREDMKLDDMNNINIETFLSYIPSFVCIILILESGDTLDSTELIEYYSKTVKQTIASMYMCVRGASI